MGNIMKGEKFKNLGHFVLEKLIELNDVCIDAFFPPGRPGTALARSFLSKHWRYNSPAKESVSRTLSRMKNQGLVVRAGTRKQGLWRITSKGRSAAKKYRNEADSPDAFRTYFPCDRDNVLRIVTFDIPERQRGKRDWIRENLRLIDFMPLQKSVWIGYSPLPEDFLEDLRVRRILSYIHIVSVKDKGTIES